MKNEKTLRSAMDRRLSFLDERPSCRPALMQRIAQEEAPVMKKKMSVGLVFALVLVSLSVIALAAGILFSPKADASRLADKAIEEKYGISLDMLTYFYRDEAAQDDGSVRVTYTGTDMLEYVLGTYTVDVRDGKAEAAWSHDGEETAGGYDAEAWGAEQLKQMLADNQATQDMGLFVPKAVEIARKHNAEWIQPVSTEEEAIAFFENLEKEKTAALEARKLSEEEMQSIAKEAIAARYELDETQTALLELYVQPLATEPNAWYRMNDGVPCFEVQYFLTQNEDSRTEKDGTYAVLVNVETGVIEKIVYESGLGGEG